MFSNTAFLIALLFFFTNFNHRPVAGPPDIFITFKTTVDSLPLYTTPHSDAPVRKRLTKDAVLHFLHEVSAISTSAPAGYWYKVRDDQDETGWVSGQDVALTAIRAPEEIRMDTLQYDFFRAEKISPEVFEAGYSVFWDSFVHGHFNFTHHDQLERALGQYPDVGLYLVQKAAENPEYPDVWFEFYDVADGRQQDMMFGVDEIPILSPDHHWMAGLATTGCEGYGFLELGRKNGPYWQNACTIEQGSATATRMAWTEKPGALLVEWHILFPRNASKSFPVEYYIFHFK